jgi:hypothetical protein
MSASNYKRLKYLGKGSYGAALLVEQKSTGVKYVMKEIVIGHLSMEAQKSAVHACVMNNLTYLLH